MGGDGRGGKKPRLQLHVFVICFAAVQTTCSHEAKRFVAAV
jgi:hypothetical protein